MRRVGPAVAEPARRGAECVQTAGRAWNRTAGARGWAHERRPRARAARPAVLRGHLQLAAHARRERLRRHGRAHGRARARAAGLPRVRVGARRGRGRDHGLLLARRGLDRGLEAARRAPRGAGARAARVVRGLRAARGARRARLRHAPGARERAVSPVSARKIVRERCGTLELELETLADLDSAVNELLARELAQPGGLERDLCPYFGVVWPAARALANELARRGRGLAQKSVLELGCGLALPALVAVKLGARVTATDLHPDVPAFLARNLALNGLAPDALRYLEHDWCASGAALGRHEFVVASDVLYEQAHPAPVARALAARVAPEGRILLADPGRAYLQACLDELDRLGFRPETEVVTVSDPALDRAGDARTREVFLIELERA